MFEISCDERIKHHRKAVAMDFTFHDTDHVYGIPEHADKFSLQDTSNSDPYRLYNLDVFEYELWNPMALYAAIPFMVGISHYYINWYIKFI